jgi:hypothetical protein
MNLSYSNLFLQVELEYFAAFSNAVGLGNDEFDSPTIFGQACRRPKRVKLSEQCENKIKVPTPALPVTNVVSNKNFMRCALALGASGSNLFDLSNYDKWFHDESVLSLAPTGNYQGADNIAKYASFLISDFISDKYGLVDTGVEFQFFCPLWQMAVVVF